MLRVSHKNAAQASTILSLSIASFCVGWTVHGERVVVVAAPNAVPVPAGKPIVATAKTKRTSPAVLRVRAAAHKAEVARRARTLAAERAKARARAAAKAKAKAAQVAAVQPQASPRVSVSSYERSIRGAVLAAQGCRAGRRGVGGLIILDFGKPYSNGHSYGTVLFSNRFASNAAITRGLYHYAVSYVRCLPKDSNARIVLARGTSNYHPSVPSAFKAGVKWARETQALADMLAKRPNVAKHVTAAAADDAEPAWDRGFRRTYAFFRGFQDAGTHKLIYNYGSLDGGVGAIWTARQAFFISGGLRDSRAVPEIYNHAMAHQWAELARIANDRYKKPVRFAGVMTQHHARFSMAPADAHQMLVRALAEHVGGDAPAVPANLTNISAN